MSFKKQFLMCFTVVSFVVSLATVTAFAAVDADHPLVTVGADDVTVNYAVNAGYEWYYSAADSQTGKDAYLAGNSGSNESNISQISLTVDAAGLLAFDYKLSTPSSGADYMMAYSINEELTLDNYTTVAENYASAAYFSYRGVVDWSTKEIAISADMLVDGSATVYIAYVHNGTFITNDNKVAIANVAFESGSLDLTLDATGGAISGATTGSVDMGTNLNLTATPDSGNRFYGWVVNDEFYGTQTDLTYTLSDDTKIQAVFATDGTYTARLDGTFYTQTDGFAQAIANSDDGDSHTVAMLTDATISESITIPTNTSVLLPFSTKVLTTDYAMYPDDPFSSTDTGTYGYENYDANSGSYPSETKCYVTLTINDGVTLTVDGMLRVGGIVSGTGTSGYQGHTSSDYAQITNNGEIVITSGGMLDLWGFVKGDGTVTAENGASVYEPFIVTDFSGGTNTLAYTNDDQTPFSQYTMENIQNTLVLEGGSALYGHCRLYASSSHNESIAPIFSTGDSLFGTTENTTVTRTYSYDADRNSALGFSSLGYCHYEVTGGLSFQSLTMTILGFEITTCYVDFPINMFYSFDLNDGDYDISNGIIIMPGASVTVGENATLTLPNESYVYSSTTYYPRLYVLDGLLQSTMSGDQYPTSSELQAAGLSASGTLIVNGTLAVEDNATFTGIVQTTGDAAEIVLADGAVLAVENLQLGAYSKYDDSRAYTDLTAKVYTRSGLILPLEAGSTYEALGAEAFTLESYAMLYMVSSTADAYLDRDKTLGATDIGYVSYSSDYGYYHVLTQDTVTIDQAMTGQWKNTLVGDVEVVLSHQTYYNATDDTRTTGSYSEVDGVITCTVALTADGANYVYLPTCTVDGVETAFTSQTDGTYFLNTTGDVVVITVVSVKLGDVNLSGNVDSSDALQVLKYATSQSGFDEIQMLTADVNSSGNIDSSDALKILKFATSGMYD